MARPTWEPGSNVEERVSKTGFTPFGFDLTSHLQVGARNVIAVMVDNHFMKASLTLGSNHDSTAVPAIMYVVFVNAAK